MHIYQGTNYRYLVITHATGLHSQHQKIMQRIRYINVATPSWRHRKYQNDSEYTNYLRSYTYGFKLEVLHLLEVVSVTRLIRLFYPGFLQNFPCRWYVSAWSQARHFDNRFTKLKILVKKLINISQYEYLKHKSDNFWNKWIVIKSYKLISYNYFICTEGKNYLR